MLSNLLEVLSTYVLNAIEVWGIVGVFVLMLLTSVNIPIPSEIVLPFSGFLAATGVFKYWVVVFVGTIGELIGSLISYHIGTKLDGKLRTKREFENAERWYKKFGAWSVFLGKLTPIIRTFISFPAGLFRLNIWKFSGLVALGSFIWCAMLTRIGFTLGENWATIGPYFREFDFVIIGLLALGFIFWIWHHFKKR